MTGKLKNIRSRTITETRFSQLDRVDIPVLISLLAAALLSGFLFVYRGGMSEPDSVVMAAGMARMVAGEPMSACMLYGRFLNPGIYFLFRLLQPVFVRSPGDTIFFLNTFGVMSWSLLTPLFYLLLRRSSGLAVAACGSLMMMLTPVFWETGTYFHPVVPALALLAGAILLFDRISSTPGGIFALVIVTVLAAAATVMRNEVLLTAPALIAAAAFSKRPKRNISLASLITALSILAFLLTLRAVSEDGPEGPSSFLRRFSSGLFGSVSPRGLLKTIPWAVMSMGTASVLLAVWGILRSLVGRRHADRVRQPAGMIVPALLWALPVVFMWVLWPIPILRHYFAAVPAIVYIIAVLILRGRSRRAIIVITACTVILNLGVPEILYRTYNAAHPMGIKEPHGTFFYWHSRAGDRIERYHAMWDRLSSFTEGLHGEAHRCAVLPANWEIYGYAAYFLAGRADHAGFENDPASGIAVHEFEAPGSAIFIVFSSRFAPAGREDAIDYMDLMERQALAGCVLLLSAEEAERAGGTIPLPVEIITY